MPRGAMDIVIAAVSPEDYMATYWLGVYTMDDHITGREFLYCRWDCSAIFFDVMWSFAIRGELVGREKCTCTCVQVF